MYWFEILSKRIKQKSIRDVQRHMNHICFFKLHQKML